MIDNRKYTGVGSRKTPDKVLYVMTGLAAEMRERGLILRSGGAPGADIAFENGAGPLKEIFRPEDVDEIALSLAEKHHPAWHRCSTFARLLHARNGYQVLGRDLGNPSNFVACWTSDGGATGGTGQAIRVANAYGIPVFNLFFSLAYDGIMRHVDGVFG